MLAVTAMSTTLTTTFGTASRRSVETMGPSRRRRRRDAPGFWAAVDGGVACGMLVRAATGRCGLTVGAARASVVAIFVRRMRRPNAAAILPIRGDRLIDGDSSL